MATGTLIFRPNADISVSHTKNTGNSGYALIDDSTADDDSTYIYQTISSTSNSSVSSVFTLGLAGTLPAGNIQITAARLYSRARKSGNGESASYACYFAAGTQAGGSSSSASTSGSLSSSYSTINSTSSSLVGDINSLISPNDFPDISVKITTQGSKNSSKDSNGYARITQVYAEFDYEEISPEQPDIPVEDPTKTYHSVTISSIKADTNPSNGTARIENGTSQTITITPKDPILTLALDNGTDITDQLSYTGPDNTYTVTGQVSGANYGFSMQSTGYYTSNNHGVSNSAAVARINFNLETDCLVTIEYINYAEARYDYGIFGAVDSSLGTTYSADSNAQYSCSSSSDNSSTAKTITYTVPSGSHYIDIKFRKDGNTDSNNDDLRWKISKIESTSGYGEYTYVLQNVDQKHSLIFVFGEVSFYYITADGNNVCRLFPDGQQVKLPGDSYILTIVPNDANETVKLGDNGTEVTSQLVQETITDKGGNSITAYRYELTNIQATHELIVQVGAVVTTLFFKDNGVWKSATQAYKKINGAWVLQSDLSNVFSSGVNYVKG